ncbi:hypothetical protein BCR44DRAFT_36126 [Catenaria anguillulae PL171]|uniref:Uncharacterized protein n=1 Tax=Catenaria anguillulae PL171 TaxID=765915 RepID=A0A1Y2HZP1_9FUNG|nr:hypothetical protein BCR44DRAFT_36126 [Catenaria anguillulae PL171]
MPLNVFARELLDLCTRTGAKLKPPRLDQCLDAGPLPKDKIDALLNFPMTRQLALRCWGKLIIEKYSAADHMSETALQEGMTWFMNVNQTVGFHDPDDLFGRLCAFSAARKSDLSTINCMARWKNANEQGQQVMEVHHSSRRILWPHLIAQ